MISNVRISSGLSDVLRAFALSFKLSGLISAGGGCEDVDRAAVAIGRRMDRWRRTRIVCCVQPVMARLPFEQFVATEQGMVRTFGRIMPVLMPLSGILAVALIILSRGDTRFVLWCRVASAVCIAVTAVTTLLVNVPINTQTASWQLTNDPSAWQQMRERWHVFQGVHGALFAAAFVLLAIPLVLPRR
jgi:uncharacterized membrane protein